MLRRIGFFNFTLVAGAVTLTLAGSPQSTAKEKSPKSAPSTPKVLVEKITSTKLSERLVYPGLVSANDSTAVLSEFEGVVKSIYVKLGQSVPMGAPLLRLESVDPAYRQAPFEVRAPIAGVVASINATIGMRTGRSMRYLQTKPLMTITDMSRTKIKIEITSTDLPKVSLGLSATFTTGQEPCSVKITGLSPVVDPATNTASGELEPTQPCPKARIPGVIGKVVFLLNVHPGIAIPEAAINYRGRTTYVIQVDSDDRVKYTDIEIVRRANGLAEINSSLKAGDRVVLQASGFVADGDKVTVENKEIQAK